MGLALAWGGRVGGAIGVVSCKDNCAEMADADGSLTWGSSDVQPPTATFPPSPTPCGSHGVSESSG